MNDLASKILESLKLLEAQNLKHDAERKQLMNEFNGLLNLLLTSFDAANPVQEISVTVANVGEENLAVEEPDDDLTSYKEAELIALAGAASGVGTTLHAISIANFFARSQSKVALADFTGSKDYLAIAKALGKKVKKGYFVSKNVDYYPDCSLIMLEQISHSSYDFIVIDLGIFSNQTLFLRSDKKIICAGGKEWELDSLQNIFESISKKELHDINFIFNLAPASQKEKIAEAMAPLENICFTRNNEDPFAEIDPHLSALFEGYIEVPDEIPEHHETGNFFEKLAIRRKKENGKKGKKKKAS